MSIFNDSRRYSDDPAEYNEWKAEVSWECRRENVDPLQLDFGYDEYEEEEDIRECSIIGCECPYEVLECPECQVYKTVELAKKKAGGKK